MPLPPFLRFSKTLGGKCRSAAEAMGGAASEVSDRVCLPLSYAKGLSDDAASTLSQSLRVTLPPQSLRDSSPAGGASGIPSNTHNHECRYLTSQKPLFGLRLFASKPPTIRGFQQAIRVPHVAQASNHHGSFPF